VYPLELFQEECKRLFTTDCTGKIGFHMDVASAVLSPNLSMLESDNYHQGSYFGNGIERLKEEIKANKRILMQKYGQIKEHLIEMSPENLPPEKGPYDKVEQFLSLYSQKFATIEPEGLAGLEGLFSTELWNEVQSILKPIYETGYEGSSIKTLRYIHEDTTDFIHFKRSLREPILRVQREFRSSIQLLSYPVLTTTFVFIASKKFHDQLFTDEFTVYNNSNPSLINLGYILDLTQEVDEYTHAVCVIRQYPFSTIGDQTLFVLDSGVKTVLKFPNYQEMIEYFMDFYTGLKSFIAIYRYSRKQYEEQERRAKIRSIYQQIDASLSTLLDQPEVSLPPPLSDLRAAAGGGASAAAGGGGASAAAGGGGGTGNVMEGGQTFYSFYSLK
jgi:hypothetical protein